MKIISSFIIVLIVSGTVFSQINEKRVALVIGNYNYKYGDSLTNPKLDAECMQIALKELGFEVISLSNATADDMRQSFVYFMRKAEKSKINLIYYSGHGIQVDGINYIVPVNTKIEKKIDATTLTINVNDWVNKLEGNEENLNVIILDACRNNPFKSWTKGGDLGLKPISAPTGTIIAFSTRPDNVAEDNGLYASTLASEMRKNQRIEDVFINTRTAIEKATKGQQTPMEWSLIKGRFFLKTTSMTQDGKNEGIMESNIYTDDFESKKTYHPFLSSKFVQCWYGDGGYYVKNVAETNSESWYYLNVPGSLPVSTRIEISVSLKEGALDHAYGILFGNKNNSNKDYFVFGITGDKHYGLWEFHDGKIINGNFVDYYGINVGIKSKNILKVETFNNTIKYYINNILVGDYDASQNVFGYMAFWVGLPGMTVLFDDLNITKLQ